MKTPAWLENLFIWGCDVVYELYPQKTPTIEALTACKLVSHRGDHNNITVMENTIDAFECLLEHNIWGVEFDVRWTKDLVPVVFHDPDGERLYDCPVVINEVTAQELRESLPFIPTLEEVIKRFGKKIHFMMEIKFEHYPDPRKQSDILKALLAGLTPCEDYHVISLTPELFEHFDFLPNETFLPICQLDFSGFSDLVFKKHYGGLTAQFILLPSKVRSRHMRAGQIVGTGVVASKNACYRELNLGIEWIFTSRAIKIQKCIQDDLANYEKNTADLHRTHDGLDG